MSEVKERVARGIVWLDGHIPDWFIKVDPDVLDIADSKRCVLGQLAVEGGLPSSRWAVRWYSPFDYAVDAWFDEAEEQRIYEYGFDSDGSMSDLDDLTEEWQDQIRHRRLEASVTGPSQH